MKANDSFSFSAKIEIIGINPFVFLPEEVLQVVFSQAKKDKGKIPVTMTIDGHSFTQTLIKYSGHWRLYLNMPMRKTAGKDLGDTAVFTVTYDSKPREITMHPKLATALENNPEAKQIFDQLPPSRRHEIVRYIAALKTEESVDRNVVKAINFLFEKERFIGRDKP